MARAGTRKRLGIGNVCILRHGRSGVLARGYSGKLDDVIDQIGVWGLSMDFIYLCFPSSLLL